MQVKHTIALACACALIGLVSASALHADTGSEPLATTTEEAAPTFEPVLTQRERQRRIDYYRRQVWHWQRIMGAPATRQLHRAPADFSGKLVAWKRFAARTWRRAQNPPHKLAWLCIHRFEGAWRDPNPPYYGGLQMDVHFQRTYGSAIFRRDCAICPRKSARPSRSLPSWMDTFS